VDSIEVSVSEGGSGWGNNWPFVEEETVFREPGFFLARGGEVISRGARGWSQSVVHV